MSGERRWEEVASVYSTRESPRGGAFIFDFTGPDGARKLLYVQGMEVVDEKAITIEQMIHTTMRLTDAREEVRRRAHDNVPVGRPRAPPPRERPPPSTSSSSSSSSDEQPRRRRRRRMRERSRSRSQPPGPSRPALRMMRVEIDPEEEVSMEAVPSDVNEMGSSEAMWTAIEEGPNEEAERIALRKASLENLYTPNIEALLEGLEGDLKVVHTSLMEASHRGRAWFLAVLHGDESTVWLRC